MAEPDKITKQRHSLAHILAYAVKDLYKDAKFGIGPVIENGFYYDFDLKQTISQDDLQKIEKRMQEIIKQNHEFKREDIKIKDAEQRTKEAGQTYKTELIDDLASQGNETVSFYTIGGFEDLCKGGHVDSTGKVGAFKLTRVSGAYWRGDDSRPQMQRIYGVAFETESELNKHLEMMEEAKKRDHRKLGREMDLFVFSELVGSGLPLFTPRGATIRKQLLDFSEELQERNGYERVFIPHITKEDLYKKSGHFDKFGDELFLVKSQETTDKFVLKPMNCPHHIQIYSSRPRSYKDLPQRYMESTVQYRDEKSGELHGLSRVRAISIDDSHVFCTEDSIEDEIRAVIQMVKDLYKALDMEFYARLSYRDESEGYLGDPELWKTAESILSRTAKAEKLEFIEEKGEAAFYGPKIDFMIKDSLSREWQCATVQLDFVQPERFSLGYTDANGIEKRPVMIHKALLGSIERFLSVYIEHTAGKFPVWLAPEQIRLITVNQEAPTLDFAGQTVSKAKDLGLRIGLDNNNESVGKKIRNAEMSKVPYVIVIGEKEIKSKKVVPRIRSDMEVGESHQAHDIDDFLKTVQNEYKTRVLKTSL